MTFFYVGGEHKVFDLMVIYFFNKYLLNTCGGPGTARRAEDSAVKKTEVPVLHGSCMLMSFEHKNISRRRQGFGKLCPLGF